MLSLKWLEQEKDKIPKVLKNESEFAQQEALINDNDEGESEKRRNLRLEVSQTH